MSITVKEIRHPYISIDKKIRGGEPVIAGTGIRVLDIAIRYEIMGMSPEDIIVALPHLNLSQIHDALSYYYEHKSEIDKRWKDTIKNTDALKKIYPSILEKKIGKIKDLHR
jgi:uncharacterized protein (DUF433 family)